MGFVRAQNHGVSAKFVTYSDSLLAFPPEVLPELDNSREDSDQNVRVDSSLVGLIDTDHRVILQQEVPSQLSQQDSVRHELDARLRRGRCVVTNLVRDPGGRQVQLLGNSKRSRHGGNSTRLSDSDHARVVCRVRNGGTSVSSNLEP